MLWWDSSPASHISSKAQSLIQSLSGSQTHLCSFLLPPPERKALKLWWPLIPLKAIVGFLTEWLKQSVAPQRIIWCGLPRGAYVSCSYTPQTQQYRPSPCLSPSLFLIVELNRIKSFSFGILFSALTLLNNPRGILTCYYPLTQCRYWKWESCEVFSQGSRQWNGREEKTCALLREEMERMPGGSRGGRPQPGPCPLQPARHSLNPIYSWWP